MLIEFARQIRQWLRTTDTRERVVERVRTCVEQKLSADDANSHDSKHMLSMPWDLIPLPSRELSLDEKCTVLAVIHDRVFSHDKINPWQMLVQELDAEDLSRRIEFGRQDDSEVATEDWPLDSNEENPPDHRLAVSYYMLGKRLNRLSEEEQTGIVELLEDVQNAERSGVSASESNRITKAYQSFKMAEESMRDGVSYKEAYEWLREHRPPEYELPSFETWQRYVREGRRLRGTQKNSPRAGRIGRSLASVNDL